jgi:hypothetical protein
LKLYAAILVIIVVIAGGCGPDPSVVVAQKEHHEFVGTEPNMADVVGTYVLSDQTVVQGGALGLLGMKCQLVVFTNGTFSVTNYPHFEGKYLVTFHSATGTWKNLITGISWGYGPDPKDIWGIQFSDDKMEQAAFTGPTPPYGLLTFIGDPDSNMTMRFRKEGPSTTPHTLP